MNLALHWCWKEWRAQRGLLAAYSLLVFACLCLGLLLAPEHVWEREGNRIAALSVFVAAGVVGVVMFAAPQLVRGEFTGKDDAFVRRLPGALAPAFSGKLLFLLLAAASLPLLGLCIGELFLQASGHFWNDLFWTANLGRGAWNIGIRWPEIGIYSALAMMSVPWVWVLATWLPGGRMAIGGASLLFLLLGLGVFAVLRQCPGLDQTVGSWHWWWPVLPLGLVIAAISWVRGRRGGGNFRSTRIGLASLGICLVPPAGWLGTQAYAYHHPDLDHLVELHVDGLSPDLRFAIARGTSNQHWQSVPLRLDLQTGAAEQLGGVHGWLGSDVLRPSPLSCCERQRYWRLVDHDNDAHQLLDLVTGQRLTVPYHSRAQQIVLPANMQAELEAQVRATAPFRAPGGRRAFVHGDALCIEEPDGSISREPWPADWRRCLLRPAGLGITVHGSGTSRLYDLARKRFVAPKLRREVSGVAVGGVWMLQEYPGNGSWLRFDPDSDQVTPCAKLKGKSVLGLFDDERLLCSRNRGPGLGELLLYRPADGEVTPLPLPLESGAGFWHLSASTASALLPRDPQGRLWLVCYRQRVEHDERVVHDLALLAIDPMLLRVEQKLTLQRSYRVRPMSILGFVDGHTMLVQDGSEVMRIDTETGERTVLFPRAEVAK